jgi:hypothetical protein
MVGWVLLKNFATVNTPTIYYKYSYFVVREARGREGGV